MAEWKTRQQLADEVEETEDPLDDLVTMISEWTDADPPFEAVAGITLEHFQLHMESVMESLQTFAGLVSHGPDEMIREVYAMGFLVGRHYTLQKTGQPHERPHDVPQ